MNDLTFDINPKNHVFEWTHYDPLTKDKTNMKTNMAEYFYKKYNIKLEGVDEA